MKIIRRNIFLMLVTVILILVSYPAMQISAADSTSVSVKYRTHVQSNGWQEYVNDGAASGTTGQSLRLEAINIIVTGSENLGIEYSVHVQDIGWQGYVSDGALGGTTGQAKRLEAIKISLTGSDADLYDIYYRVHVQGGGWLDWAKNGSAAGTEGLSQRLEAIEIKVVKKTDNVIFNTTRPFVSAYGTGEINYRTHVQDYGWQGYVSDGTVSGTQGQAKRLEGINIRLGANMPDGSVVYSTHIQGDGWKNSVSDGALSGTVGQSKRLEAININLTGEIANIYDIYYRVHIQGAGWLGWAKNGEYAGSTGFSYRLEAIEIVLVTKGDAAPGSTEKAFLNGWQTVNGRKYYYDLDGVLKTKTGIDVSHHQGQINWEAVKNDGIEFAIIRIGYGDDMVSQDDNYAVYNMNECERLGIPYGVYLYSYATSFEQVNSEVSHTLRMIQGRNPQMGVYYDMENYDHHPNVSNELLSQFSNSFMNQIRSAGYSAGLYSGRYWLENVLTQVNFNEFPIWVAEYNDICTYNGNYILWQYTSKGTVAGINGDVDMDVYIER